MPDQPMQAGSLANQAAMRKLQQPQAPQMPGPPEPVDTVSSFKDAQPQDPTSQMRQVDPNKRMGITPGMPTDRQQSTSQQTAGMVQDMMGNRMGYGGGTYNAPSEPIARAVSKPVVEKQPWDYDYSNQDLPEGLRAGSKGISQDQKPLTPAEQAKKDAETMRRYNEGLVRYGGSNQQARQYAGITS